MDNTGVRVPLTRMRRKLSVEQNEEAMSPSTPSTPTKKRPTRLAKPLLDNIDENLTVSSPRRVARKSISKDNMELNEEKISTPSRRNIRIMSNTSITSETAQTFDSPRAKRAARRNSLAGSDTEGPATPVRPTRRARKDSSSSIENQAEPVSKPTKPLIVETILEEPVHNKPENDVSPNSDKSSNSSLTTVRKSPRLLAKKGILTTPDHTFEAISEDTNSSKESDNAKTSDIVLDDDTSTIANGASEKVELLTKSKRKSDGLDISASKINSEDGKNNESAYKMSLSQKIQDTSTISNDAGDKVEHSTKSKRKSDVLDINASKVISEVGKNNESPHKMSLSQKIQDLSTISNDAGDKVELSTKSKRKSDGLDVSASKVILEDGKNNESPHEMSLSQKIQDLSTISNNAGDKVELSTKSKRKSDGLDVSASKVISEDGKNNKSSHKMSLSQIIQGDHEDDIANEDSNCSTTYGKNISNKLSMSLKANLNTDDQCVPVVDQNIVLDSTVIAGDNIKDNSCEPMDIDETITENVSYRNLSKNPESKNNSILSVNKSHNSIVASPLIVDDLSNRKLSSSTEPQKDTSLLLSKNNTLETHDNNPKRKSSSFEVLKPNQNQSELIDSNSIQCTKAFEGNDSSKSKLKCDTPLKHKDLQNLGIQTSTPNIEKHVKTTKSNSVNNSKHDRQDSSSELSDAIQSNQYSLLNDEAEDAGDYESGDSQDEEQKRYEEENEIVEKGETLSSEEDLSNDSDYEKDSFIVSSNEGDDDLLSGTGDDLDSSDNELTMSAKSKLKYNERKNKERSRASKEMFESRHRSGRTKSESFDDVITRGKKGKRQRIDSIDDNSNNQNSSTSEDEKISKPKIGKNRQRLNSTLDDVHNNSKNATIRQDYYTQSPNGSKRDDNKKKSEYSFANNENEITAVFNQSTSNARDPLTIKVEPATPNVSSLNITGVGQIEEVQIDENVSMIKSTTTLDPLHEASDDSASLSSENEEIKDNYESVLASLNNLPSKQKLKMFDNSLNLNKATNKKVKQHPIIDQLNITQTKKDFDSIKNNKVMDNKKGKNKSNEDIDGPDYTNLSVEVNVDSSDNSENNDYEKLVVNDNADFIPFVQSKANISLDKDESMDVEFDETSNKNKSNRKSSERNISTQDNEVLDANTIEADLDKFLSRKKRNSYNTSDQLLDIENGITGDTSVTLNDSTKKKKKNRKNSEQQVEVVPQDNEITDETTDPTLNESTIKKKKNRKNSGQHAEFVSQDNEVTDETTDLTLNESTIKKKKNRKNSGQHVEFVSQDNEVTDETTHPTLNESPIKKKKNRKNSGQYIEFVSQDNEVTDETTDRTLNESTTKKKKNKKDSGQHAEFVPHDIEVTDETTDTTLNESITKKKKNRKVSGQHAEFMPQDNEVTDKSINATLNTSITSKKKNRKNSGQYHETIPQNKEAIDETTNETSTKKKKNRNNSGQYVEILPQDNEVTDKSISTTLDASSSKKKKSRMNSEQTIEASLVIDNGTHAALDVSSTKKKKKSKRSEQVEITPQDKEIRDKHAQNKKHRNDTSDQKVVVLDESVNLETTDPSIKKKKKHKKLADDCFKTATAISDASKPGIKRNKRRRQSSSDLTKYEDVDPETVHKKRKVSDGPKIETKIQPNSMKRKRDDVEGLVQMKVFKDEFNIRRLPFTVIDQLEEKAVKPNKSNKSTKPSEVVSTVTFNVEEAKQKKMKNKPSRYLEDSVYIDTDDQSINEKPNKHKIKKPKVLPFLPTVSTSSYGCTTNFKINIIPKETAFVAKATDIPNFKDNYLYNQKIKRLGTYEKYKRNIKLSKF